MSEIIIGDVEKRRRERRSIPIYVKMEPDPSEAEMDLIKVEFEKALIAALAVGEKIPYTDAGIEIVQKMFMEAYKRVLPNYVSISVIIEK